MPSFPGRSIPTAVGAAVAVVLALASTGVPGEAVAGGVAPRPGHPAGDRTNGAPLLPARGQWGLTAVRARQAWRTSVGSRRVRVAVIDSGVWAHPDLKANLAGSFLCAERCRAGEPLDATGHGTMVAGIIGATGRRGGVRGVAPLVSLVSYRVVRGDGTVDERALSAAVRSAGRSKIGIVNLSITSFHRDPALRRAVRRAPNTLFVVAAGNDGLDVDDPSTAVDPCSADLDNVVCVTAGNPRGRLTSFANYGRCSVDLAAPGADILTTMGRDSRGFASGTSMAAPFVTGTAALIKARLPGATPALIKHAILRGTTPNRSLRSRTASGGNLDAARALRVARGLAANRS